MLIGYMSLKMSYVSVAVEIAIGDYSINMRDPAKKNYE